MSHNLPELHNAIIDFLTAGSRIMFAHRLAVWNEFAAVHGYKYADYSNEDLHDEFVKTILPRVYTFELTDVQRRKIEIFASHHQFTPTTLGFREREYQRKQPVEGVDYVREENAAQFPNIACVVRDPETNHSFPRPDVKIAAWTSAVNSTDEELAEFALHRGAQLQKRVEEHVKHFQDTGECPANLTPAVAKKIIGFRQQADELSSMNCDELPGDE